MGGVVDDPPGLAVTADDFGLRGPRGWAFRGVSADAEPGSLIAVEGPSGSGRTCLLLALTGRMRPTEGTAAVGGLELPGRMAAVRRRSALAHVGGVTDLDPALTVGEHLREQALMRRRFGGSFAEVLTRSRGGRAREEKERVGTALTAAGLDPARLPKGPRTAVRDLERVEALRLSLALALLGRPRLIGMDDTDLKLSPAEREEIWTLLRSLTETGTTVLAVCREAPRDAVVIRTAPGRDDQADPHEEADAHDETDTHDQAKEAAADACAETGRS